MQVTDLGAVLHMVGGTAASYMIFFLPGMLLLNAAIVKKTASMADLQGAEVSSSHLLAVFPKELVSCCSACAHHAWIRIHRDRQVDSSVCLRASH